MGFYFGTQSQISILPLREEWDSAAWINSACSAEFQSSHSARSGTYPALRQGRPTVISILPLREEWDHVQVVRYAGDPDFNPPTPRGVGLPHHQPLRRAHPISILPLREEWDGNVISMDTLLDDFNPPTPRGVGPLTAAVQTSNILFQSSHSARSGTLRGLPSPKCSTISILPLREEWDQGRGRILRRGHHFNPPTPRGVGQATQAADRIGALFQSSHSARSGTAKVHNFFTVP